MDFNLAGTEIISPDDYADLDSLIDRYLEKKSASGITREHAELALKDNNTFATLLLSEGKADGLISGIDCNYAVTVRPVLEFIGLKPEYKTAAALYMISIKGKILFLSDTAINLDMNSEKLADIAIMSAEFAKTHCVEPRVAMLSYSNFGNLQTDSTKMIRDAVSAVKTREPSLVIDGEMQADAAVEKTVLDSHYSFSSLDEPANILIFPDMQSANISFKLLHRLADARVVGPIIVGLNKPAYVLQKYSSVDEIFNMITVAVAQASLE